MSRILRLLAIGACANAFISASAHAVTGAYFWSYAAKFVCGYQPPSAPAAPIAGEPVVKPGNYATEINIHNPNFRLVPLIKRVVVLVDAGNNLVVREPQMAGPSGGASIEVPNNSATLDDCNALWVLTHPQVPALPAPLPLFVGYLVILSPIEMNVNTVFTASAPGDPAAPPTSAAINVLTVTGKRVFIPSTVTP